MTYTKVNQAVAKIQTHKSKELPLSQFQQFLFMTSSTSASPNTQSFESQNCSSVSGQNQADEQQTNTRKTKRNLIEQCVKKRQNKVQSKLNDNQFYQSKATVLPKQFIAYHQRQNQEEEEAERLTAIVKSVQTSSDRQSSSSCGTAIANFANIEQRVPDESEDRKKENTNVAVDIRLSKQMNKNRQDSKMNLNNDRIDSQANRHGQPIQKARCSRHYGGDIEFQLFMRQIRINRKIWPSESTCNKEWHSSSRNFHKFLNLSRKQKMISQKCENQQSGESCALGQVQVQINSKDDKEMCQAGFPMFTNKAAKIFIQKDINKSIQQYKSVNYTSDDDQTIKPIPSRSIPPCDEQIKSQSYDYSGKKQTNASQNNHDFKQLSSLSIKQYSEMTSRQNSLDCLQDRQTTQLTGEGQKTIKIQPSEKPREEEENSIDWVSDNQRQQQNNDQLNFLKQFMTNQLKLREILLEIQEEQGHHSKEEHQQIDRLENISDTFKTEHKKDITIETNKEVYNSTLPIDKACQETLTNNRYNLGNDNHDEVSISQCNGNLRKQISDQDSQKDLKNNQINNCQMLSPISISKMPSLLLNKTQEIQKQITNQIIQNINVSAKITDDSINGEIKTEHNQEQQAQVLMNVISQLMMFCAETNENSEFPQETQSQHQNLQPDLQSNHHQVNQTELSKIQDIKQCGPSRSVTDTLPITSSNPVDQLTPEDSLESEKIENNLKNLLNQLLVQTQHFQSLNDHFMESIHKSHLHNNQNELGKRYQDKLMSNYSNSHVNSVSTGAASPGGMPYQVAKCLLQPSGDAQILN